ncbi:PIN domain-containing protein [Kamptonema sp. UHCC 0994]|uniref:PIN domain-containing protein n=1 Tax=Kamptonema sp. UHCC 0994 TaxID=3031329 RepID=UPI0023B8E219|nr:PIN domain-containing protein [Kamptonema sp. UHCC 0994]MDF0554495.1 PIN domain-containing protein [Kamptonema sp. UHCC 0994]
MSNNLPAVLLILDVDVVMGSNSQTWQQYAKAGSCYVPEVVFEEMEFLADEADSDREKLAREFLRFFPASGWAVTDALETHPNLEPAVGGNQSKHTRMVVAIAQCVYGFALENPESLVVFVCNNQPLLKRMQALNVGNLCGITAAMLSQWAKRGEQPMPVTQQLQNLMRSQTSKKPSQQTRLQTGNTSFSKTDMSTGKLPTRSGKTDMSTGKLPTRSGKTDMSTGKLPTRGVSTMKPTGGTTGMSKTGASGSTFSKTDSSRGRPASRQKTSASKRHDDELQYEGMNYRPKIISAPKGPGILSHLINGLGALFFLTLAIGIAWRGVQPESFNQFWQQKVVPVLPQQVKQFVK